VVVVKHDGLVRAFVNWCPHLGIELNFMPDQFMDSDNQFIMCANHGALFEIDSGDCLSGPCSGDKLIPVPLEVRGDEVWLGPVEVPA
jgi:nitrite reductase/ring-hydroxylating ferredoxin subunit